MHSDLIKEALDKAAKLSCFNGKKLKLRLDTSKVMLFSSPNKRKISKYWATVYDNTDRQITSTSTKSLEEALTSLILDIDLLLQREVK